MYWRKPRIGNGQRQARITPALSCSIWLALNSIALWELDILSTIAFQPQMRQEAE
jgi:hypothetical protein